PLLPPEPPGSARPRRTQSKSTSLPRQASCGMQGSNRAGYGSYRSHESYRSYGTKDFHRGHGRFEKRRQAAALQRASPRGEMLDAVRLGNYRQAALRDEESAAAVQLVVKADLDARGNLNLLVDNRAADLGVAADIHTLEEQR